MKTNREKGAKKMLREVLKNRIQILEKVVDWREAIQKASTVLIRENLIEESYVSAMIQNVEKYGNYIVVAPKVAMPHARPEEGVRQTCLSLLKLEHPVFFGEEEVFLIFVLAARDNNSHIDVLTKLMEVLEDEEKIEHLIGLHSIEEIIEHI